MSQTFNVIGKHITGNAGVFGNARVSDNARVSGNAGVSGDARVSGNALVSGNARVYGIKRSDGYVFCYVPCTDNEWRIIAGCRYFTMQEARQHWNETHVKSKETNIILDCLEALRPLRDGGI